MQMKCFDPILSWPDNFRNMSLMLCCIGMGTRLFFLLFSNFSLEITISLKLFSSNPCKFVLSNKQWLPNACVKLLPAKVMPNCSEYREGSSDLKKRITVTLDWLQDQHWIRTQLSECREKGEILWTVSLISLVWLLVW